MIICVIGENNFFIGGFARRGPAAWVSAFRLWDCCLLMCQVHMIDLHNAVYEMCCGTFKELIIDSLKPFLDVWFMLGLVTSLRCENGLIVAVLQRASIYDVFPGQWLEFPFQREQTPKLRHSLESEDRASLRKELLSSCTSASILIANIISGWFFLCFNFFIFFFLFQGVQKLGNLIRVQAMSH